MVGNPHTHDPLQVAVVCRFQPLLLRLCHVPGFDTIHKMRHHKGVEHLHFGPQPQMSVPPHNRKLGKGTQSPAAVGIHLGCQAVVQGQNPPQVLEAINPLYWPPVNGDDGRQL